MADVCKNEKKEKQICIFLSKMRTSSFAFAAFQEKTVPTNRVHLKNLHKSVYLFIRFFCIYECSMRAKVKTLSLNEILILILIPKTNTYKICNGIYYNLIYA